MKQDIQNQYDDDLTLGSEEYDDSYYTDADDLFNFSTDDESPISRLKSLVLSIDWEITDEVLLQFNEELIDLRGIWAGNSINLVYIQALEKISKYIYQNKANSHPHSIKLLLTLYYNLEKIVSSQDLSEAEKKAILLEDVKRFETLKRQISQMPAPGSAPRPPVAKAGKEVVAENKLLNLKAIVLGIDWEITDQDLNNLRAEVIRLEKLFADSRPKLILLQGIGTLGAYIKTKKSNAHADAFNVLHLFYESLEKIVKSPMSLQEEKAVLFHAVEQFNRFKALLGQTISPEAIDRAEDEEEDEEFTEGGAGEIAPALADVSDEESIGFQAEEEAKSLGIDSSAEGVASQIDSFFGNSGAPAAAGGGDHVIAGSGTFRTEEARLAAGLASAAAVSSLRREVALQGVDVEADDEEEDEGAYTPAVAALADADDAAVSEWRETGAEPVAGVGLAQGERPTPDEEIAGATDSFFADSGWPSPADAQGGVDRDLALQGVDVETEADEDADEIFLPMEGDEIAPALLASEGESLFSAETLESKGAEGLGEEIAGTLDDLFLEETQFPAAPQPDEAVLAEMSLSAERLEARPQVDEVEAGRQEFPDAVAVKEETAASPVDEEDVSLFFTESDPEEGGAEPDEVASLFDSLEPAQVEEQVPAGVDGEAPPTGQEEAIAVEGAAVAADAGRAVAEVSPDHDLSLFAEESTAAEEITPFEEENSLASEDVLSSGEDMPAFFAATPPIEESPQAEEVVFELADEAEAQPVSAPPAQPGSALADETAEDGSAASFEVEDTLHLVAPETDNAGSTVAGEPLAGLHECIQSLGIELKDEILSGLFQELKALEQQWSNRPLEKTFLQLLSTIARHIEARRFEADSAAHNLLLSVYTALAARREEDVHYSQELLLAETQKVLEWQQGMLARRAVQDGAQQASTAFVPDGEAPACIVDARQEFDQLLQQDEEDAEEPPAAKPGPQTGLSRESLAAELKQEIVSLRLALQREIAELRREVQGR